MSKTIWNAGSIDLDQVNAAGNLGLSKHLGITFVDFGDDWLAAEMPVDERTVQPFGRLHGGASVALAETVASVAGTFTVDPERQAVVGQEINANHIRPADIGRVRAVARPEALQRRTQIWSIRITDEQDRLICISRMTLAVISVDRAHVDRSGAAG